MYRPNILDGKTKELIALSNSVMADCIPCIEYHYRMVVKAGASKEEIAESLAIAMSVSAGSKKTYVFIGPILPFFTYWKKIIYSTKESVDFYMFENLNITGTVWGSVKN
ncbi:MAG: hypothetical protein FJW63_02515 [Actinobacteria bacterium]|nr:hypothetical protein [Actinomycetota bacterium]